MGKDFLSSFKYRFFLVIVLIMTVSYPKALFAVSDVTNGESWSLIILAKGLDLGSDYTNEADVLIGMADTNETIPSLMPPPGYTVFMKLKDLYSQLDYYYKDIRKAGSEMEVWLLKVEIPDDFADPDLFDFYPVLSWDTNDLPWGPYDLTKGTLELRRGRTGDIEDRELLKDMISDNRYQTQEADGTASLWYTIIYKAPDLVPYYYDGDKDGFGDPNNIIIASSPPMDYVAYGTDCYDDDPNSYPGAAEACDGKDNDCDGQVPPGEITDSDGDGAVACSDCYDDDPNSYPGAAEVCDGKDNDCDGQIPPGEITDSDGDGAVACSDCDDTDDARFPGNLEICDDKDNDCNWIVDDPEKIDYYTYYRDSDADGYGDPNVSKDDCMQPEGYMFNNQDCDDEDPDINPAKAEVCDNIDNNCNGQTDEGVLTIYYRDMDNDGYGDPYDTAGGCAPPKGYVEGPDDCDDSDAGINPLMAELFNGKDDDCDGVIDNGYSPEFATFPITEGEINKQYAYTATVKGEPPFSGWELEGGPSWLSLNQIDQNSVSIAGTPQAKDEGRIFQLSLSVSNTNGTVSQEWGLHILPVSSLAGVVLADPQVPFCDGNCDILPFKIEIYNVADGLPRAGTHINGLLKSITGEDIEEVIPVYCQYDNNSGNYHYSVTGLGKGFYTITVSDGNPGDTYLVNNKVEQKEYKSVSITKQLAKGADTLDIPMHIVPSEYRKLAGHIFAPADKAQILLYGQTDDGEGLKSRSIVDLGQTGGAPYYFFIPGGIYNLTAWAKGCMGEEREGLYIQADQNIPDIQLQPESEPSLSIISKQEGLNLLRLNFRCNNPGGEAADWETGNKVEMIFFTTADDPDSTGRPIDTDNPSGQTIQLADPSNVGSKKVFPERYLTYLIDAKTHFMGYIVQNTIHVYRVVMRIRLINSVGEDLIDPFIYTFEVKGLPESQRPISQTIQTFKVGGLFTLDNVPVTGTILTGTQNMQIMARFSAYNIDPTLLLAAINQQGRRQGPATLDELYVLSIALKPEQGDPNSIMVDINFADSSGNALEYNPPDPITGQRDEAADPIVIDVPLHKDFQGKGYSPEQAALQIALNPETDFQQVNGELRPVSGKYCLYKQTVQGAIPFIPADREGIEIVVSRTGLLMASVMVKDTSPLFFKTPEEIHPDEFTARVCESCEADCFIKSLFYP